MIICFSLHLLPARNLRCSARGAAVIWQPTCESNQAPTKNTVREVGFALKIITISRFVFPSSSSSKQPSVYSFLLPSLLLIFYSTNRKTRNIASAFFSQQHAILVTLMSPPHPSSHRPSPQLTTPRFRLLLSSLHLLVLFSYFPPLPTEPAHPQLAHKQFAKSRSNTGGEETAINTGCARKFEPHRNSRSQRTMLPLGG